MKINVSRQVGATLIEVIMVVALIALIVIGSLLYYNTASHSNKVREAVSGLNAMSSIIENMYATQPNYVGLNEALVVNSGSVQANIKSTVAGNLKHPWSQEAVGVTVASDATSIPANKSFIITFTKLPKGACIDLAMQVFSTYPQVRVNGTLLLTGGQAAIACTSEKENTMAFTQG